MGQYLLSNTLAVNYNSVIFGCTYVCGIFHVVLTLKCFFPPGSICVYIWVPNVSLSCIFTSQFVTCEDNQSGKNRVACVCGR